MDKTVRKRGGEEGDNIVVGEYSLLERLSQSVDQNKQLVSLCLYGVMGAGAILAARSLKISKQFKCVGDIPREFTSKNVSIFGVVEQAGIKENERRLLPYLYVSHIPIFGKTHQSVETQLPVRVIGVNIDQDQLTASQSLLDNLVHSKVKVKLLDKSHDELFGQVFIKKFGLWGNCVGRTLLKQGLAEFSSSDIKNTMFNNNVLKYETQLLKQENYAKRKKIGKWRDPSGSQTKARELIDKILKLLRVK